MHDHHSVPRETIPAQRKNKPSKSFFSAYLLGSLTVNLSQRIPAEMSQLREELERIRAAKLVKRQEREEAETKDSGRLV